jgi:hypothetical protein
LVKLSSHLCDPFSAFQTQFERNVQITDKYNEIQKELETSRTTIEMLEKINRDLV